MGSRYVWDLETNGLLDEVTTVHCLVLRDLDTGDTHVFNDQPGGRPIAEGLTLLQQAELLVGHNSLGYDTQVIKKLYGIDLPFRTQRDTLVLARLLWPEQKRIDAEAHKAKRAWAVAMPGHLTGRASLEAWGYRLNERKGEYAGDERLLHNVTAEHVEEVRKFMRAAKWAAWNPSMEAYMVQDSVTTVKLWDRCMREKPSEDSVRLEHHVAWIIQRQERHGFLFDEKKAVALYAKLVQRRVELEAVVKAVFRPVFMRDGSPKQAAFTPARDNKAHGYTAGAEFTKVKLTEFNPSSRDHVAYWLKLHYGWTPTQFTPDGKPKIDDDVIAALPYDEAAPLKEYFMVVKRVAQLAEGTQAWLKKVHRDGRIRGRVNTNGAVTGRMTHDGPNMAQVPATRSPYGQECRELFIVAALKRLVGIDADALELRDLAGYMGRYDGGEYIRTVLEGNKAEGTDMHSVNCRALGMVVAEAQWNGESGRDVAKTWFYAFIYGAGDEQLGYIQTGRRGPSAVKKGKAARAAFLTNLPAMGKLVAAVRSVAKERGYLVGLDGRHLSVRSQHGALNTLLQSAGAIQMKRALCIFDDSLQAAGLVPGTHYEFVSNVHDEWQLEVDDEVAEQVGRLGCEAIRLSGESFGFRCPLAGNAVTGHSWADTH